MADVAGSHPEFIRRYNKLVELCWERSWYVGVTSSTRSYAEQTSLYIAYKNGTGNNAANPNAYIGVSPWGWKAYGSYHMVQQDGYSHALDLHWSQCTPQQFASLAATVGLRLTVPGENWHFQWWDTSGFFPAPALDLVPQSISEEEDEMTLTIHRPIAREQAPGSTPVYDFTYLPADTNGQSIYGWIVSSYLYLRRHGGASTAITVYVQGVPTRYEVPADGTTIKVPVTAEGLVSVVGDVYVEAREQWRKG